MTQIPIVTLTLNPALDMSTEVPKLVPDEKLRCAEPLLDSGGGGLNVSRGDGAWGRKSGVGGAGRADG
jgi:6-phosphofructokinase 2